MRVDKLPRIVTDLADTIVPGQRRNVQAYAGLAIGRERHFVSRKGSRPDEVCMLPVARATGIYLVIPVSRFSAPLDQMRGACRFAAMRE